MQKTFSRAQGTIEYLVIIAIIIVIALFVTSLFSGVFNSNDTAESNTKLKNQIGYGGVSILDAATDSNGDVRLVIQNVLGTGYTITGASSEGTSQSSNNFFSSGQKGTYDLNSFSECACEEGELTKTCTINLYLLAESTLDRNTTITLEIDCVEDIIVRGSYISESTGEESESGTINLDCTDLDVSSSGFVTCSGTTTLLSDTNLLGTWNLDDLTAGTDVNTTGTDEITLAEQ